MYNLCIHDLKANKSKFYVWDKVNEGWGSVEIVACLNRWIEEEYARAPFHKLKVVTDNSGGQNKNINVILYYLKQIHDGKLKIIEHLFLVPGHSYMPCDRAFGNIEKCVRVTGEIYDFEGYCRAIRNAIAAWYTVIVMQRNEFLDVEKLQKLITVRRPRPPYGSPIRAERQF